MLRNGGHLFFFRPEHPNETEKGGKSRVHKQSLPTFSTGCCKGSNGELQPGLILSEPRLALPIKVPEAGCVASGARRGRGIAGK